MNIFIKLIMKIPTRNLQKEKSRDKLKKYTKKTAHYYRNNKAAFLSKRYFMTLWSKGILTTMIPGLLRALRSHKQACLGCLYFLTLVSCYLFFMLISSSSLVFIS